MKTVFDEAIEAANTYFQAGQITKRHVWKKSKEKKYVRLRSFIAAFMRARDPERFSYPMIARALKHKDHTTAINAVRNAHKEWGQPLFIKLAAVRPVDAASSEPIEQPVHSVTAEEILAVGSANLTRFVNGQGWQEQAA